MEKGPRLNEEHSSSHRIATVFKHFFPSNGTNMLFINLFSTS